MFHQVKQNRIFLNVLDQLESAILNGQLKPGDKLPPERELRETMVISRATLREAFRALEQKGLIEIKLGVKGGTYIKELGVDQIAGGLGLLIHQRKISLQHLYEFREGAEGVAAGLATERATDEDFRVLQETFDQAGEYIQKGGDNWRDFYEVESRLHQLVAQISGNPIYEFVFSAIHTNINSYSYLLPQNEPALLSFYKEWDTILHFMRKREVTKVHTLTTTHASRANEFVQKASSERGNVLYDIMLNL
jgi:DNA-binding FadR family transcriptional regulator